MEQIRISEKNKVTQSINDIKTYQKRNKATIDRLKTQEQTEFNKNQIIKLSQKNDVYETDLETLNQKFNDITNGTYDTEFVETINKTKEVLSKKKEITDKKILVKQEHKTEDKNNLQKYYDSNKKDFVSDYSLQKETDRFFKNTCSIPDYIKVKLKDMPNNKGYIWKGVLCFGDKNKRGDDILVFENFKGGITKSYEVTGSHIVISEKQGNNRRLISKESR